MIFYQKTQTGFSLVETLVAISILLLVIVGPMTISMRTAKSSSFASEQVQAFFLAQEGVEFAQKIRDDLLLKWNGFPGGSENSPWAKFTDTTNTGTYRHCFAVSGCGLQWSATAGALATVIACDPISNCAIYRSTAGRSWFSHTASNNTPTIFTRRVYFTSVDSGSGVFIRSVVTWRTGSIVAEQKVEVNTYLYNIYDTP